MNKHKRKEKFVYELFNKLRLDDSKEQRVKIFVASRRFVDGIRLGLLDPIAHRPFAQVQLTRNLADALAADANEVDNLGLVFVAETASIP